MGCPLSTQQNNHPSLIDEQEIKPLPYLRNSMFIVQGLIGVGGFGEVLAVTLQQTGKWYALKVINKANLLKHKSGHAMIFGELDAMSRVEQHPFIVSMHLAYHDRKNCYFAMDLKTGGDLRYYLRKKMIFEERDVVFYVACISAALHHIHSKNMLHRDIKPENIILDERGWPHLADFGVAYVHHPEDSANKYNDTLTCTLASGTKQYLGPEVFGKEHIHGPEADFWFLAVVAYELLFPKRPFEKHCAIEFITYLERALSKQRKHMREERVREVQGAGLQTELGELGSADWRQYPSAGFSPEKCAQARGSPSISASTSRDSNSAFFPALGVMSRTGSFDQSAPDCGSGAGTPGFCSSVQYTPANTSSQGLATRRSGSGSTLGLHSQGSSRGSSPHCGDMEGSSDGAGCGGRELSRGSSSTLHRSCDRLEGLLLGAGLAASAAMVRPSTVGAGGARGISFDASDSTHAPGAVHHLPPLGSASGDTGHSGHTTPPKQNRLPKQGAFLPPTGGPSSPVKTLLQQQAALQQQFSCNQKNPLASSFSAEASLLSSKQQKLAHPEGDRSRLPYGNHWAVDDDASLAPALRVHIPSSTSWGKLSPECVSYLKAAFDIRPSHRLSSRDIDAIRTHPWLQMHGLSDWQELYARNYAPNFKPGKRFMKDIFSDPSNTMLPGAGNVLHDPDGDSAGDTYWEVRRQQDGDSGESAASLTAEQLASFRGFRYTAPALQTLFVNKEPALRTCSGTATTSAEALTGSSKGSRVAF